MDNEVNKTNIEEGFFSFGQSKKEKEGEETPEIEKSKGFTIEALKALSNKMVVQRPSGIGRQTATSIVYYTPGEQIVGVDMVSGGLNIPFKIGDKLPDVISWVEESDLKLTYTLQPRRKKRLNEQDSSNEISLYDLCYQIALGRYEEGMEERFTEEFFDDLVVRSKGGDLYYKFETIEDFCEFFFDGDTESSWNLRYSGPDYDYYTDSVYQDTTDENYHVLQMRTEDSEKVYNKMESLGFPLKTPKERINGNYSFISDEWSNELGGILKFHFPKSNETLSDLYVDRMTESYAEGYSDEQVRAHNEWLNAGKKYLGMEEISEYEEYTFDIGSVIGYMLMKSKAKSSTMSSLIEGTQQLRNSIGSGSDINAMDEARYDYQKDEPLETLRNEITDWVETFIDDTLDEHSMEIKEMVSEKKHITKIGFIGEDIDFWDNNSHRINWSEDQEIINKFKPENVKKTANGNTMCYIGYSIDKGGHMVLINDIKADKPINSRNTFKSYVLTIKEIYDYLNQVKLELSESLIIEQKDEFINSYYAMMSDLTKHYGDDNVKLIGSPPKIVIGDTIITYNGKNLLITKNKKVSTITVDEYKTKTINGETIDYPSVEYITNRVSLKKETKKPKRNLIDGTTARASQSFWDEIKVIEGSPKKDGKPVLKAYKLGDGRVTIGWGHTGAMTGKPVKVGDVITVSQAQKFLQDDATKAADCVRGFLSEWKEQGLNSYMITQNMFDVLVSLSFNAGCTGLRKSKFIQLVKKGEHEKAAKLLPNDTTMINGKFTKGLTNRRKEEAIKYLK